MLESKEQIVKEPDDLVIGRVIPIQNSKQIFEIPLNKQEGKADKGKPDYTTVSTKMIKAIEQIRAYGIEKYGSSENWREVERERYIKAMYRHFIAFLENPLGLDKESGYPHLWHLDCNANFLTDLYYNEMEGIIT